MNKIIIFSLLFSGYAVANDSYMEESKMKNPNTGVNVFEYKNNNEKRPYLNTLIVFRSNLAANTDGSPHSYSSIHLDGGWCC